MDDIRVSDFSSARAEQHEAAALILRATRAWVRAAALSKDDPVRPRLTAQWSQSFEHLDVDGADVVWSSFLRMMTIESWSPFRLGCLGCGRASEDEHLLLACLAAFQAERQTDALDILNRWVNPDGLVRTGNFAAEFAWLLKANGLDLTGLDPAFPLFDLEGTMRPTNVAVH